MAGFPPKSSIFVGFSIINHSCSGTPILGNTHIIKLQINGAPIIGLIHVNNHPYSMELYITLLIAGWFPGPTTYGIDTWVPNLGLVRQCCW